MRYNISTLRYQKQSTYAENVTMPFAIEGAFNPLELKRLQELMNRTDTEDRPALTMGDADMGNYRGDDTPRVAYENAIPFAQFTEWYYNKLEQLTHEANEQFYGFELDNLMEPSILLRYESSERGKYDFHVDAGGDIPTCFRKLSSTILVNDPSEYEGGELLFGHLQHADDSGNPILHYPKTPGTIIFFPSYLQHAVTPVTKGTRHAIVTWFHGPPFK